MTEPATEPTADPATMTDTEWRARLTPEQFHILREKGTERAGTGVFDKHYANGEYTCAGCGQALFESNDKYDSGCGWPAFTAPTEGDAVTEHRDVSFGMVRTEVVCSNCGGHLGHVFNDGPREAGGLRYCINSASLDFAPDDQ